MLRIKGSAGHSRCRCLDVDLHALIMSNLEHRVLRIEPISLILLYKGVLVIIGVLNLHRDKNSQARTGERREDS